jgi:hypothetical protein
MLNLLVIVLFYILALLISEDEILVKLKVHNRLMSENFDLNMKVKMLQLDKTRLQQEVDKMK